MHVTLVTLICKRVKSTGSFMKFDLKFMSSNTLNFSILYFTSNACRTAINNNICVVDKWKYIWTVAIDDYYVGILPLHWAKSSLTITCSYSRNCKIFSIFCLNMYHFMHFVDVCFLQWSYCWKFDNLGEKWSFKYVLIVLRIEVTSYS